MSIKKTVKRAGSKKKLDTARVKFEMAKDNFFNTLEEERREDRKYKASKAYSKDCIRKKAAKTKRTNAYKSVFSKRVGGKGKVSDFWGGNDGYL